MLPRFHLLKSLTKISKTRINRTITSDAKYKNLFEPAYIDEMKPKVGYYGLLNVRIKGHDYAILEKYQSYVHKTMRKLDLKVVKSWSCPHKELEVESLAHQTSAVVSNLKLNLYERTLQIKEAQVTKLTILIDVLNMTLPPGVSFGIQLHTQEQEDQLYFRDSRLEKLKEELAELQDTPLIGA